MTLRKKSSVFIIVAVCMLLPLRAFEEERDYDVVVIGAGGGGLASGAKLALAGLKVLLIEQHYKVGGYMTSFERGPYTFEVSLHAMDGLDREKGFNYSRFRELDLLDRVEMIRLEPSMYRVSYPDFEMDIPSDPEEYRSELKRMFPHEAQGIDELFETMYGINEAFGLLGMAMNEKLMQAAKTLVLNPRYVWTLAKYWNKKTPDLVKKHISDERLYAVFTQLSGFAGVSPGEMSALMFAIIWNSYHQGGYYYFKGGSQAVSNAMADVIRENSGEILLSTMATKIIIENGAAVAVQTDDGSIYRCRYVISNANAPDTFFKLVGKEHLPESYVRKLEGMKIGASIFSAYIGVDHDYSDYFKGAHDIMVSEDYDVEKHYILCREGEIDKVPYVIADYSVVDPACAPEGKNVITIITLLTYDWREGWYEDESYAKYTALKEEVAWTLIKRAEHILPELGEHIEVLEVGSPRTMEHFTLNPRGTIFGWENIPGQILLDRLSQKTPVDNLYLAGAWTRPGGGQSAVMLSGIMAANTIIKKEKIK